MACEHWACVARARVCERVRKSAKQGWHRYIYMLKIYTNTSQGTSHSISTNTNTTISRYARNYLENVSFFPSSSFSFRFSLPMVLSPPPPPSFLLQIRSVCYFALQIYSSFAFHSISSSLSHFSISQFLCTFQFLARLRTVSMKTALQ